MAKNGPGSHRKFGLAMLRGWSGLESGVPQSLRVDGLGLEILRHHVYALGTHVSQGTSVEESLNRFAWLAWGPRGGEELLLCASF